MLHWQKIALLQIFAALSKVFHHYQIIKKLHCINNSKIVAKSTLNLQLHIEKQLQVRTLKASAIYQYYLCGFKLICCQISGQPVNIWEIGYFFLLFSSLLLHSTIKLTSGPPSSVLQARIAIVMTLSRMIVKDCFFGYSYANQFVRK